MTGRLVLLSSSPRVAPGLLSWPAWQALRDATEVWTGSAEHPLLPYLAEAGIRARVVAPAHAPAELLAATSEGRSPTSHSITEMSWGPRLQRAFSSGRTMPRFCRLP